MLIDKVNLINPIKINISLFHSPHSVIVSHQLCPIELNLTLAIVTTGVSVSLCRCRDQASSGSDAHCDVTHHQHHSLALLLTYGGKKIMMDGILGTKVFAIHATTGKRMIL